MPKTSAKELQRRKEAARLQQQRIEAQTAKLQKQGLSAEQIRDALGLPKMSPSMQFLYDRIGGHLFADVIRDMPADVSLRDANVLDLMDDFERKLELAMVDLLRSDIPLDRESRRWIANRFLILATPNAVTKAQKTMEARFATDLKRELEERGATAYEAEQRVAEFLGLPSVDALRKKVQRARK
jgi:hypothetical protein